MVYDPNKPCMDIGTVYPNMVEFRLIVRQFAINKEFALHTVKTDTERFIGTCFLDLCYCNSSGTMYCVNLYEIYYISGILLCQIYFQILSKFKQYSVNFFSKFS
jgi:hypothetical protein